MGSLDGRLSKPGRSRARDGSIAKEPILGAMGGREASCCPPASEKGLAFPGNIIFEFFCPVSSISKRTNNANVDTHVRNGLGEQPAVIQKPGRLHAVGPRARTAAPSVRDRWTWCSFLDLVCARLHSTAL
ncbi:hypothetical protein M8818_001520 [Zalaria obscura]|uniref:Uncharacterized protein n=1 Tax=Zalaria obscura TaxID=2024903 RepID=A0ACC3SJZ1_9PEZI